MTEIYIIRHAQAEGNLYRMMQGNWDGDVTPLGLRQIDALAERFRHVKIDARPLPHTRDRLGDNALAQRPDAA